MEYNNVPDEPHLQHAYLAQMNERHRGRILEEAETARNVTHIMCGSIMRYDAKHFNMIAR